MITDKGGHAGPRSEGRRGQQSDGGQRYRQPEQLNRDNPVGAPPAVPGFGFQFPVMANGMPMFPGPFGMPPGGAQPPPPGAG